MDDILNTEVQKGQNREAALILIDVQVGMDDPTWGERNNHHAEGNMVRLLTAWREKGWPVVHIQHSSVNVGSPLRPELPGFAIKLEVAPIEDEPLFVKSVNSGFIGTNLEGYLREQGIESLVIVGLTTDHCVSTTVRMAGNLGFDVLLVGDGTATFERFDVEGNHISAEEMHRVNLASLHGEFCRVVTCDDVLGMLTAEAQREQSV